MGFDNYPPGVTGHELQIAGPSWEGDVTRACEESVEVRVVDQALVEELALARQWGPSESQERLLARLQRIQRRVDSAAVVEVESCPFDDEVEAWMYGGLLRWTCPLCGTEHEEVPDVE